jgi:hypothetical protein
MDILLPHEVRKDKCPWRGRVHGSQIYFKEEQ